MNFRHIEPGLLSPLIGLAAKSVLISLAGIILSAKPAVGQSTAAIDFNRDIRPILSENCYFCHGPDADHREAGLRLDVEAEARNAIAPGHSKNSELFLRISSDDSDHMMPPPDSNRQLNPEQIAIVQQWIDEGATWAQHWAFAPVRKPDLPTDKAIDTLIERKLKQHGLTFSPQADRATLIRRVSLDLTGLPPTVAQLDEFLSDESTDAYAQMVNRFLDSAAYGERMAWNWLDAARYADTNGYQGDNERTMWPWRDWVVSAYNQNMPFDQFSTWQLAGDLLPNATDEQILATGFNRNHPINGEGGRIAEENRIDYGMDMAETAGTVWMGLTFNCCRCHDHKYDNLTQDDYYSLFAFFDQTPVDGSGGNAQTPPVLAVPSDSQRRQKRELETTVKTLEEKLTQQAQNLAGNQRAWELAELKKTNESTSWIPLHATRFTANASQLKLLDDLSLLASGANPDQDDYQIAGTTPLQRITAVRLEVLNHPTMNAGGLSRSPSSNFVLTDFSVAIQLPDQAEQVLPIANAQADFEQPNHAVTRAIDENPESGWAVWKNGQQKKREHQAIFVLQDAAAIPDHALVKVLLRHQSKHKQHNIGRFRLSFTDQPEPNLPGGTSDLLAAIQTPVATRSEAQKKLVLKTFLARDPVYTSIQQQLESARLNLRDLNRAIPQVMVMKDLPTPRKSYRLHRGSYEEPRNEVSARVPQVFSPLPANQTPNRLALANWLFEDANPLTARVAVNRLWTQIFGIGLVKTLEDFGVQGEPPSHPELLDWLAAEYRDSGWDTKHMIRILVNSRTYRQSSRSTDQLRELDPENRLHARAPRYRLPSWMIRDHALAASGSLVKTMGGQPVNTYQPSGVWEEASFGKKVFTLGTGEDLYRRTLYTFWRRIAAPTMLFDNADRMTCSVKTYRTNTPLHALNTLNDVTFVEASRMLATTVLQTANNDNDRLDIVFRRVLSRLPDPPERELLIRALDRTRQQFKSDLDAARKFISTGQSGCDPALNEVELASWTSLCLAVLNLDEAMSRQ